MLNEGSPPDTIEVTAQQGANARTVVNASPQHETPGTQNLSSNTSEISKESTPRHENQNAEYEDFNVATPVGDRPQNTPTSRVPLLSHLLSSTRKDTGPTTDIEPATIEDQSGVSSNVETPRYTTETKIENNGSNVDGPRTCSPSLASTLEDIPPSTHDSDVDVQMHANNNTVQDLDETRSILDSQRPRGRSELDTETAVEDASMQNAELEVSYPQEIAIESDLVSDPVQDEQLPSPRKLDTPKNHPGDNLTFVSTRRGRRSTRFADSPMIADVLSSESPNAFDSALNESSGHNIQDICIRAATPDQQILDGISRPDENYVGESIAVVSQDSSEANATSTSGTPELAVAKGHQPRSTNRIICSDDESEIEKENGHQREKHVVVASSDGRHKLEEAYSPEVHRKDNPDSRSLSQRGECTTVSTPISPLEMIRVTSRRKRNVVIVSDDDEEDANVAGQDTKEEDQWVDGNAKVWSVQPKPQGEGLLTRQVDFNSHKDLGAEASMSENNDSDSETLRWARKTPGGTSARKRVLSSDDEEEVDNTETGECNARADELDASIV